MTPKFIGNLDLRAYEPGEFVVLAGLQYISKGTYPYYIPRGFITDLASIPRLMRPFFDRTGKSMKAAVLHDYLYCTSFTRVTLTRARADYLFLEALKACEVNLVERWAMYAGVRAGGWVYWNKRVKEPSNGKDFVNNDYWEKTK